MNNCLKWAFALMCGLSIGVLSINALAQERPLVVTSIKPLAMIAADIGGELVAVDYLVPVNRSPHDFALKVSDVKRVNRAQLLVWTDSEMELFMTKLANANAKQLVVSELPGIIHQASEDHDHHYHSSRDPHYWLNPGNAIVIAEQMGRQLSALDPANKAVYQQAVQQFKREISALAKQSANEFADSNPRPVLVQHDAYGHFIRHFGLRQMGALRSSSGAKAGARTMGQLLGDASQAACLLADPQYDMAAATRFSWRTGLPVLILDPLAGELVIEQGGAARDNYRRFLMAVVNTFKQCFNPS